jgi:lipoprotein NlpD
MRPLRPVKRLLSTGVLLLLALSLAACSSALRWTPDYHTVRAGETLYSIAMRYNLDHRRLAAWNNLGDGTYIRNGQKLSLKGPASSAARQSAGKPVVAAAKIWPAPKWNWPTAGTIAVGFGASPKTESGIRIAGRAGQPIVAVADGEVVYAGAGLPTYGQLLIIKHNDTWLSAYGFNSLLRVKEGARVRAGQHIADMGQTRAGFNRLHFEIRRNGQPVNPQRYLPRR